MTNWHITEQGLATVTTCTDNTITLNHPAHDKTAYHNAQISSYDASRRFTSRPPLRLSLKAQANTSNLRGTAGFGFWNHPFAPNETRFDVPQAVWFFFASDDSDMALAQGVAGHGWKASTFNAKGLAFYSLLPTAPLAMPLMNIPFLYDSLWHIGQDAIGAREHALDTELLAEEHHYQIDWLPDKAIFRVDGEIVLEATQRITRNALGFVAWLDNQYAIVSPKGRFGFGLVDVPQHQSLTLRDIRLEEL